MAPVLSGKSIHVNGNKVLQIMTGTNTEMAQPALLATVPVLAAPSR
jgi:hypothetical protein